MAPNFSARAASASRARRSVGNLIDQGLWTLSNLVALVAAAHLLNDRGLGAVSLCQLVYTTAALGLRALTGTPLLIRFARAGRRDLDRATTQAAALTLLLGVLLGAGTATCGLFASEPLRSSLLVLAPFLPVLLLQDLWRLAWITEDRPWAAAADDFSWLALAAVLFLTTRNLGVSAAGLVGMWCFAGTVAAGAGLLRFSPTVRPAAARAWFQAHRSLAALALSQTVLLVIMPFTAGLLLGAVAGLNTLGELRAGQTLVGPIRVIMVGAVLTLLPQMVRVGAEDADNTRRFAGRLSLALAGVSALWTVALLVTPASLGRLALGSAWHAGQPVAVAAGVGFVAVGLSAGPMIALLAFERKRPTLIGTAVVAVTSNVGILIGGARSGAVGASVGQTLGVIAALPVWWAAFSAMLKTPLWSASPGDAANAGAAVHVPGPEGLFGLGSTIAGSGPHVDK